MALSDYFTDDELISQLKMYFELEEMWNIDFNSCLSQVSEYNEDYFFLNIKNKNFIIEKITGIVQEVE